MMKIALFHNPSAGSALLSASKLMRLFENTGHDVRYTSIKENGWEKVFAEPFDRIVIAGGDGTISRLAPWLAARETPFCILPLGTANNCARSLGQMNSVESVISGLPSGTIRRLDLGILTSADGHRMFVESIGIGLLAAFISEMRAREDKKNSRSRLTPEERLTDALKNLRRMAKDYPDIRCELLLDDEVVAGRFLLLEIANMAFIGPNLRLFPRPDPSDGWFDVVWIEGQQRDQWRNYLQLCRRGEEAIAPATFRRCRRISIRYTDASAHVDSKVFHNMVTPVSVRLECGVLRLVDLRSDGLLSCHQTIDRSGGQ